MVIVNNTTDHFRSSWNNYKSDVRKAKSGDMENVKQKSLQSHSFQRDRQGFLKDVDVRLIERTQFYWMRTPRTLYADGLNIESDC